MKKEKENVVLKAKRGGSESRFAGLCALLISNNCEIIDRFKALAMRFGLCFHVADSITQAMPMILKSYDRNASYNIVFLDFNLCPIQIQKSYSQIKKLVGNDAIISITKPEYKPDASINKVLQMPITDASFHDILKNYVIRKSDDLSDICLLLAEDAEVNRVLFSILLEDTGITIDNAENGRLALEMFQASPEKYDIIIMDIHMPELNGLEATQAIRALNDPWAKLVPIVSMTACSQEKDIKACFDAGMNGFMSKPVDGEIIKEKILFYTRC